MQKVDYNLKIVSLNKKLDEQTHLTSSIKECFSTLKSQSKKFEIKENADLIGMGFIISGLQLSIQDCKINTQLWHINSQINLLSPTMFFKASTGYLINVNTGQENWDMALIQNFEQIEEFEGSQPIYSMKNLESNNNLFQKPILVIVKEKEQFKTDEQLKNFKRIKEIKDQQNNKNIVIINAINEKDSFFTNEYSQQLANFISRNISFIEMNRENKNNNQNNKIIKSKNWFKLCTC